MKATILISKLANAVAKNGDFDIDIEMPNIANNADGNEFVDLGLPSGTLWAKCNYGVNKETSYGNLYKWDEAMKLPIQLPTREQLEELAEHTTSIWVKDYKGSRVNGRLFISNVNSNYIFIPASGYASDGSVYSRGSKGCVWSSILVSSYPNNAWCLLFGSSRMGVYYENRCLGRNVRGVVSK